MRWGTEPGSSGASRTHSGLLGVLLLSAGLFGCSAEPVPLHVTDRDAATSAVGATSTGPDSSPESGQSATPVSVPVAETAADRGRTDRGATEFASAWFASLNRAYRDGDLSEVRSLSDPNCSACADYFDRWQQYTADPAQAGARLRGDADPFRVSTRSAGGATTGVAIVELNYQVQPLTLRDGTGATVTSLPGEPPTVMRVAVRWVNGTWQLGELGS